MRVYRVLLGGDRCPTRSEDILSCKKKKVKNNQVIFWVLFPTILSMEIGSSRRHSYLSYLDSSL